jgi:hypothetical protein
MALKADSSDILVVREGNNENFGDPVNKSCTSEVIFDCLAKASDPNNSFEIANFEQSTKASRNSYIS